jgi:hypothetical protein
MVQVAEYVHALSPCLLCAVSAHTAVPIAAGSHHATQEPRAAHVASTIASFRLSNAIRLAS